LEQLVLAAIAAVRCRTGEVLRTIQFDRDTSPGAYQVDFKGSCSIEGDG
jgi:hypothetical protein